MSNAIVVVDVSLTAAPIPNGLQQVGAFASQGATSLPNGTRGLLTQLSDLTPLLAGALAVSAVAWASSVVTVTTAAPHGLPIGQAINLTLSGFVPTGYNGNFVCTPTTTTAFTFPLTANPGTATTEGVYTEEDVEELLAMATTFFAQGAAVGVYVLELGAGSAAAGVSALAAWITANPLTVYNYLVPRYWASEASFPALVAEYEAPTSFTNFWITVTQANYASFTAQMANGQAAIEAPGIPVTEFSLASVFYKAVAFAPSATNKVTPLAFTEVYGVTPYPTVGTAALLTTLKAANINYFQTGAEGGITTSIYFYGKQLNGLPFSFRYATDYAQIALNLSLSNAVINGSNNPQAPLYYDQPGVNTLQATALQALTSGVEAGVFLGPIAVSAVPFATYVADNPENYAAGIYDGISASLTPQRGFQQIIFQLNVSDFVTG